MMDKEKTSSGLVVESVAVANLNCKLYPAAARENMVVDGLVRLSDAEAIIAAKDVEIRQWWVLAHQEHGYVLAENRKQAERINELEADVARWRHQADEAGMMRVRYGNEIAEQSAALKLAREAFEIVFNCRPLGYETMTEAREEKLNQALAAIDNLLKGERRWTTQSTT